ncbi:hypothetical protein AKJ16_DCAP08660 [Drosera capensis]
MSRGHSPLSRILPNPFPRLPHISLESATTLHHQAQPPPRRPPPVAAALVVVVGQLSFPLSTTTPVYFLAALICRHRCHDAIATRDTGGSPATTTSPDRGLTVGCRGTALISRI